MSKSVLAHVLCRIFPGEAGPGKVSTVDHQKIQLHNNSRTTRQHDYLYCGKTGGRAGRKLWDHAPPQPRTTPGSAGIGLNLGRA